MTRLNYSKELLELQLRTKKLLQNNNPLQIRDIWEMSSSEIKLNIKLKEFFPWVFPFVKEVKCERISGIQSRFLASLGMMMLLHETELWLGIRFLQILGEAIKKFEGYLEGWIGYFDW